MGWRFVARLMAPTLLVSFVFLALGAIAAWNTHRIQQDYSSILTTSISKDRVIEELVIKSHDMRHELSQFLATGDQSHIEAISSMQPVWQRNLRRSEETADTDRDRLLIRRIKQGYERFFSEFADISRAPNSKGVREKALKLIRTVTPQDILQPLLEYRRTLQREISDAMSHEQTISERTNLGMLVLGICGILGGLLAGIGFARAIHRSIVRLTVPIHDVAGNLDNVVGPVDISATQDIETTMQGIASRIGSIVQRLRESEMATRRAEQMASLGQLATSIAHELRNPITSIKIILQTAMEEGSAPKLDKRDFDVMIEEINRLDSIIREFLDYARPPKPVKQPFILRDVLEQTVDLVSHRASKMGVVIERELPDDIVQVQADAGQIRQLLLNMLINALEVSPEKGRVRVSLAFDPEIPLDSEIHETAEVSKCLQIEVEDEGPGIPPEMENKIFEPFVSTKDSGTGLGLAICQRIVDDHGGSIRAKNRPGGGAIFVVRLPVEYNQGVSATRNKSFKT